MKLLRTLAVIGNILFLLWNAVDERAQGVRPVEAAALGSLAVLLGLNTFLLARIKELGQPHM